MDSVILLSFNLLFLTLLTIMALLERRIRHLKSAHNRFAARTERRLRDMGEELETISARSCELWPEEAAAETADEEEGRQARLAEKRFTEGIASILGYGLNAPKPDKEDKQ